MFRLPVPIPGSKMTGALHRRRRWHHRVLLCGTVPNERHCELSEEP